MAKAPTADRWRIAEGARLDLKKIDTSSTAGAPGDKEETRKATDELRVELEELQNRLYAESKQSLLVVLQAMDTGGKDGTIRKVFSGVNPQGVKVHSFKAPTEEELAHDFLWRAHAFAPRDGDIMIFNRSHYEDVLIVRVHDLAPKKVWQARYGHIQAFERLLADDGTKVLKVFLHISEDEQKARLQARVDTPDKHWKFNPADLEERKRWADYQHAYRDAIAKTSTAAAPWFVVPADRKWYRDWAVLTVIVEALRAMKPSYPPALADIAGTVVE